MEAVLHTTNLEPGNEILVSRFRAGDRHAFDVIVTRHRKLVYSVARRLLRNHADADEAAQTAFVNAWQARASFRGEAPLRSWLARIVMNVAKSMLAARKPTDPIPEDPAWAASGAADADRSIDLHRLRRDLRVAVNALPARQQEVVLLKVYEELTYREVAVILGLSEGAIKAHLHQAIANLRKGLEASRRETP